MEGPAFSTRAESEVYRSWGMSVIGMTNLQEAKLAREAEVCYATMALVTDYDCWHPGHDSVTVDMVIEYLNRNAENAHQFAVMSNFHALFSRRVAGIVIARSKEPVSMRQNGVSPMPNDPEAAAPATKEARAGSEQNTALEVVPSEEPGIEDGLLDTHSQPVGPLDVHSKTPPPISCAPKPETQLLNCPRP